MQIVRRTRQASDFFNGLLRVTEPIVAQRGSRGVGVDELIARYGRTEKSPVQEVSRNFHAVSAGDGIAELKGHVGVAQPGEVRHREPRAGGEVICIHGLQFGLTDDAIGVNIAGNEIRSSEREADWIDLERTFGGERRTGKRSVYG